MQQEGSGHAVEQPNLNPVCNRGRVDVSRHSFFLARQPGLLPRCAAWLVGAGVTEWPNLSTHQPLGIYRCRRSRQKRPGRPGPDPAGLQSRRGRQAAKGGLLRSSHFEAGSALIVETTAGSRAAAVLIHEHCESRNRFRRDQHHPVRSPQHAQVRPALRPQTASQIPVEVASGAKCSSLCSAESSADGAELYREFGSIIGSGRVDQAQ